MTLWPKIFECTPSEKILDPPLGGGWCSHRWKGRQEERALWSCLGSSASVRGAWERNGAREAAGRAGVHFAVASLIGAEGSRGGGRPEGAASWMPGSRRGAQCGMGSSVAGRARVDRGRARRCSRWRIQIVGSQVVDSQWSSRFFTVQSGTWVSYGSKRSPPSSSQQTNELNNHVRLLQRFSLGVTRPRISPTLCITRRDSILKLRFVIY